MPRVQPSSKIKTPMTGDTAAEAAKLQWDTSCSELAEYVEAKHIGRLDHIESNLGYLGDPVKHDSKDEEALRAITRKLITSTRREEAA